MGFPSRGNQENTDSIEPIENRTQNIHGDFTKAAQAFDEECYPGTQMGSKEPTGQFILRYGPGATHRRAHELSGFGAGAFGELSAKCSEQYNLAARAQAAPKGLLARCAREFGAPGGLATQVACARLIIAQYTKFIIWRLGDPGHGPRGGSRR